MRLRDILIIIERNQHNRLFKKKKKEIWFASPTCFFSSFSFIYQSFPFLRAAPDDVLIINKLEIKTNRRYIWPLGWSILPIPHHHHHSPKKKKLWKTKINVNVIICFLFFLIFFFYDLNNMGVINERIFF